MTQLELYKILQLRNEVFVVEQNCVYLDADNKDQSCYHLAGSDGDLLVAYTRLMPAGIAYKKEASIGRVVTSAAYRNTGIGRILMQKSIEQCRLLFNDARIKIGAQLYLQSFYESFGFKQLSDIYLEDGIEHIEMLLLF
ncbi:MAG: GNAT family N-acetyltransferase [Parafilimonas sp.]